VKKEREKKQKKMKMNVLGSIGKQTGESVESVLKKEEEKRKKGYGGKDV